MQRCACIMPAAKHALADAFLQPLPGKANQKFHCWLLQTVHNGTIQPVHLLHLEAALGIPVRREMFLIISCPMSCIFQSSKRQAVYASCSCRERRLASRESSNCRTLT